MLPFLAAALLSGSASAGAFSAKSMREEWPERQVDRELTLPKGWYEVHLAADHKRSTAVRDYGGVAIPLEDGAAWDYSRAWFGLDHGISRRTRVYLRVPVVRASLRTATAEGDFYGRITTLAMGDAHTGIVVQPWAAGPDTPRRPWALAAQLDLKAPSGVEWAGGGLGAPDEIETFATGTGITNLGAFVHGKWRTGGLFAAHLGVGWVFKFPAVTGYVVQIDGFGNGKLDPGDELRVDLDATVQAGDMLAFTVDGRLSRRGWTKIGVSGEGVNVAEWDWLEEPALFVDVGGAVSFEPDPAFELRLDGSVQALGTTTALWAPLGLEELAPQPGLTLGLEGVIRW